MSTYTSGYVMVNGRKLPVYYMQAQLSKQVLPPEQNAAYNTSKYEKLLRKRLYSFAMLTVLTITIIFRPYWH
jgi:predicted anti-sigma-YlaC factor YlaD